MQKAILKSTFIFSLFTVLAQVLAVLRDIVLVRVIGVGSLLDTYYLSFKIPDLISGFYMIFLGSVIFIPIITKTLKNGDSIKVSEKISELGTFIFSIIILLSGLLFIFIPLMVSYFIPHLPLSQQIDIISLSRVLLVSQMIFPIGIVAGAVCMVYGKVLQVAISSALYNLGILLGAMFLYPILGLNGLGYGVIFGAILFTLVQIYPTEVRSIFLNLKFKFDFNLIKNFIRLNLSRFASVFSWQVFLLLLIYIATFYGPSAVSIWSIAYSLEVSIISIIGVSIASVLMPIFSESYINQDKKILKENFTNSSIFTIWLGLFVGFVLYFTSTEIIKVLFYFSNLSDIKAVSIAFVFSVLILSLPMQNYFEILRKFLYATNRINAVSLLILLFISLVFIFYYLFATFVYFSLPVVAIAFAFLFANIFSIAIFSYIYRKEGYIDYKKLYLYLKNIVYSILSSVLIYIFISLAINYFDIKFIQQNIFENIFIALIFKLSLLTSLLVFLSYIFKDKVFLDFITFAKTKWKK